MPNWCNNSFAITGCVESIKDLWDGAQEAGGLLQAIKPMPAELEDTTSPGDSPNWYNWRVDNWGTKWDVDLEGLEFIDNGDGTASISGWFDSAWAPPIGAYEQLADDFDSCVIECSYYEPGMDFGGFWSSEDGDEYCEDLHEEYNTAPEHRSDLFNRLDQEYDLCEQFAMWDDDTVELDDSNDGES